MTARYKITCGECGRRANLPVTARRWFCSCGAVHENQAEVGWRVKRGGPPTCSDGVTDSLQAPRIAACKLCEHYMGNRRCKLIDLGCMRVFNATIEAPDGVCPAGKWNNPCVRLVDSGENLI